MLFPTKEQIILEAPIISILKFILQNPHGGVCFKVIKYLRYSCYYSISMLIISGNIISGRLNYVPTYIEILDIGSNIGPYTLAASVLNHRVIAVDPMLRLVDPMLRLLDPLLRLLDL